MMLPNFVCSLIKWCRTSICLVRQWFLLFRLLEIDLLLSAKTLSGLVIGNPTSSKYFDNHKA